MITWIIEWMKTTPTTTNPAEQVVQVGWRCNGLQESEGKTYTASIYGSAGFTYTEGAPFTPFNQLTQEQVLEWVWASGVDKAEVEANVQRHLDAQINPQIIQQPLPWV
jgi:hypothetical protein